MKAMVEMFKGATPIIFENAKRLRESMTNCELLLWNKLCKKQVDGYRFRRQHPVASFIADFYCHKARLVIEIDGEIHNEAEQVKYDAERTKELESFGLRVIRFTNAQVQFHIDEVIKEIKKYL